MTDPERSGVSNELLAQQELDNFANNEGLAKLAQLFGLAEIPDDQHSRLAAYQGIAASHWDFRKGAERQATDWDDNLLDQPDSDQYKTIFESADRLGLVKDTEPVNKKPDYLVFLGGANRAPLDRLKYGLEKLEDFGQVAYLGSTRSLSEAEKEKSKDYAPGAETEFDLGCGALETLLRAKVVNEYKVMRDGDTWQARLYEFERDGETKHAFALSTPNIIGGKKRATTYDNYAFFADVAELSSNPNQTVVSVTTGFYTVGQHLPAVAELTLKHGTRVETIGHSAQYSGATRKPSQLLQETKTAVGRAVKLELAIASSNQV